MYTGLTRATDSLTLLVINNAHTIKEPVELVVLNAGDEVRYSGAWLAMSTMTSEQLQSAIANKAGVS